MITHPRFQFNMAVLCNLENTEHWILNNANLRQIQVNYNDKIIPVNTSLKITNTSLLVLIDYRNEVQLYMAEVWLQCIHIAAMNFYVVHLHLTLKLSASVKYSLIAPVHCLEHLPISVWPVGSVIWNNDKCLHPR